MLSFLGRFYGDEAADAAKAAADKAAADKAAADKAAADEAAKKKNDGKFFTQDEVNAFLAKEKRELKAKLQELEGQTADLPKYQTKLKELQDTLLTKEELAKQEAERAKKEYDTAVEVARQEAGTWKGRYLTNTFDVQFAAAAHAVGAPYPDQLGPLVKDMCKVVENTDDKGTGLGTYKVIMTVDDGGKTLTLPVKEGLEKLKEQGKYPNQFNVSKIPGTGGSNFGGNHVDPGSVPRDMKAFTNLVRGLRSGGAF